MWHIQTSTSFLRIMKQNKKFTSTSSSFSSNKLNTSSISNCSSNCFSNQTAWPAVRCNLAKESGYFDIYIKLHVKPGAKKDQLLSIEGESLSVQISAPPSDGEANKSILKFFSELLDLPKSDISLVHGHKSRDKTILVKIKATTKSNIEIIDSVKTNLQNFL